MINHILIIIYSAVFIVTQIYFLKKNDILALIWFFLAYIYSIFTILGYTFYTFVPESIGIFSSKDTGTVLASFVLISYLLMFVVYYYLAKRHTSFIYLTLVSGFKMRRVFAFELFNALLLIGLGVYFSTNVDRFNWGAGSDSQGSSLFAFIFRYFIVVTLIQFFIVFEKVKQNIASKLLILFDLFLVLLICIKSGSRSDLLYLTISLLTYAFYDLSKIRKIDIIKLFAFAVLLFFLMQLMLMTRHLPLDQIDISFLIDTFSKNIETFGSDENSFMTSIILNDYFAPAATLAMSIDSNIVIPYTVFVSNTFNSIYFVGYSLISDIVAHEYGFSFLRGAGFAYFIFTEGFNVMGNLGVLYNGIIFGGILYCFRVITLQGNAFYTKAATSIVCLFVLSAIRGQSGIIAKMIIFHILPAIITLYYAFGFQMYRVRK